MSEKELELYKLYRPERELPKIRGTDLLKDPRLNKVYYIDFIVNFYFFYFSLLFFL